MATAQPDIVREVVIAAPPEVVFPFFTDPETMSSGRRSTRSSILGRAASSGST